MAEEIDKYEEDVDRMIDTGKEKGYLTYGEVNDLIPEGITSADELDDLLMAVNTQGIDVLNSEDESGGRGGRDKFGEESEENDDVELDLTPGQLEKTKRSRAHVPARDGNCSPAHPRGRSGNCQAHRTRASSA